MVEDFLPPPENLVFKEDTIKATLGLSSRSVDFFKKEAKKHHPVPENDPATIGSLRYALSATALRVVTGISQR